MRRSQEVHGTLEAENRPPAWSAAIQLGPPRFSASRMDFLLGHVGCGSRERLTRCRSRGTRSLPPMGSWPDPEIDPSQAYR